jgi:hypothetical protein
MCPFPDDELQFPSLNRWPLETQRDPFQQVGSHYLGQEIESRKTRKDQSRKLQLKGMEVNHSKESHLGEALGTKELFYIESVRGWSQHAVEQSLLTNSRIVDAMNVLIRDELGVAAILSLESERIGIRKSFHRCVKAVYRFGIDW